MLHSSLFELCCISGALFIASNVWFYVRVLRPIQKLSFQANRLSQGDFDSFEHQCGGIAEIQKLQLAMSGMVGHVRRAQKQRRAYSEQLSDGQESERKRIARELHDDTIQSIIAVTQAIDMAKNWINSHPDRALNMLDTARKQAVDIVSNLRNLIGGLRPPALEELGLVAALQMLVDSLCNTRIQVEVEGDVRRLDEAQELALFRAAQEALQNIQKHSQAQHIVVKVAYKPDGVLLKITDDGVGFLLPESLGDLAFENRYGLLGMQERVSNLGGQLTIESKMGKGTAIHAFVPSHETQLENLVRDPVCSALIEPRQAYSSTPYGDDTYYFCCPVCQGAFQSDPQAYIEHMDEIQAIG